MQELIEYALLLLAKIIAAFAFAIGILFTVCVLLFANCESKHETKYICTFEGYHKPSNTLYSKQSPYLLDTLIWCDTISKQRVYGSVKCECEKI